MEEQTKILYDYINEIGQDVASVKRLVEDVPAMKQDLIQMKQHIEDLHANLSLQQHTKISERLELPGTSHAETFDMASETASTISLASTGSEDENTKQHTVRTKCMSEAIQRHFLDIVRRVPFDGIVDKILENDLVTISENERIREFHADEDKMRYLVRNIMNKSYETMNTFLIMVGKYDNSLRHDIQSTFDIRYNDESPDIALNTCTACLIKKRINIKIVGDHFFSQELVSQELHMDITDSSSTNGNDSIWCRFFQELSQKHPEHIMNVMKDVLKDGEGEYIRHYEDIIKNIDKDIRRHRKSFKCRCSRGKTPSMPLSFHSPQTVAKRLHSLFLSSFSQRSSSPETVSPPVSPNSSLFEARPKNKNKNDRNRAITSESIEAQGNEEIFDESMTRHKRRSYRGQQMFLSSGFAPGYRFRPHSFLFDARSKNENKNDRNRAITSESIEAQGNEEIFDESMTRHKWCCSHVHPYRGQQMFLSSGLASPGYRFRHLRDSQGLQTVKITENKQP